LTRTTDPAHPLPKNHPKDEPIDPQNLHVESDLVKRVRTRRLRISTPIVPTPPCAHFIYCTQSLPRPDKSAMAQTATRLVLKPSSRGARKLATQFGERLICVRYRYDASRNRRYKTVELIVDEREWRPRNPDTPVGVRIGIDERDLQVAAKCAGGHWDRPARLWRLPRRAALSLRLQDRIVES
jgi:hypothetical protein